MQMRVSVGVHHRGQPEERIGVTTIALHPSWTGSNVLTHDLAVLTLAHPVTFTDKVRPVCLPSDASLSFAGETATAAGWGLTDLNNQNLFGPDKLKKVQVNVITGDQCRAMTHLNGGQMWWVDE